MSIQETQGTLGAEMGKKRGGMTHAGGPTDIPPDAPYEAAKAEFARRLQTAMIAKGWHQSELARRASGYMPRGEQITRDMVSKYIRAFTLPSPKALEALAKAVGKKADELLPTRGVSAAADHPAFDIRGLEGGNAWLRINQAVPMSVALKIMELLNRDKES
jgi:transcriptional regulator with XRE-family HTH domain